MGSPVVTSVTYNDVFAATTGNVQLLDEHHYILSARENIKSLESIISLFSFEADCGKVVNRTYSLSEA